MKTILNKLLQQVKELDRSLNKWDSVGFARAKQRIEEELHNLAPCFQEKIQSSDNDWERIRQILNSPEYSTKIKAAFDRMRLSLNGNFPAFDIPPFKIEFSIDDHNVILKHGRKIEKRSCLEPDTIAKWIKQKYNKVVNSPFNAIPFARELTDAYEYVNKNIFRLPEINWGHPVSLNDIYEILTIRASSRKEMPKEVFIFNLTRLIENGLYYNQKRFDFGYSRNAGRMFLLVDKQGNQSRYSTLTIHLL